MNQKKMSVMLKGIAVTAGMMGLIFLAVMMPMLALDCRREYEEFAYLFYPGLAYGWLIGILAFAALYEFWKICTEIGRDNSFSKENVLSLNRISMIAMIEAGIWFVGLVGLIIIGSIGIGFIVLMTVAIVISLAISIIATVLAQIGRAHV